MKIIATTKSHNCLVAYLSTCQEPLRSLLYVETGYSVYDRLIMRDEDWESIPPERQDVIIGRTLGFIDGWEAKENWENYE